MPRTLERPMLLRDDPVSYEPANLPALTFEGGNPPGLEGLRAIAVPLDHCHGCTRPTAVEAHAFGLAQVLETRRTWPGEGRSAAARVVMVALPFLVGVVTMPGQVTEGHVLRLALRLCPVCLAGCQGWRGQVRLTATEYAWHPWWEAAQTLGYTTLIPPAMLHIPPNLVVRSITAHRKPPEVRICRLRNQSRVGTVPPSTSTPHWLACCARRW
jgi:hypothetical protein